MTISEAMPTLDFELARWSPVFRRIVVGIDGSPNSLAALRTAVRLGVRDGAKIEAVCAYQPFMSAQFGFAHAEMYAAPAGGLDGAADAHATLEDAVRAAFGREHIDNLVLRAIEGGAFEVLTRIASEADLLVVGARGYSGRLSLLLGSTAQACVRHAKCPVLVVPAAQAQPASDEKRLNHEKATAENR